MPNSLIVYTATALLSALGLLGGIGIADVVESVTEPPGQLIMTLKELRFEDGKFGQSFRVTGKGKIKADWAAKVTRGSDILCAGGGTAPYSDAVKKELSTMAPDIWTGDDCPPLQAGDIGEAIWTYKTQDGSKVTISGEVTVTDKGLRSG